MIVYVVVSWIAIICRIILALEYLIELKDEVKIEVEDMGVKEKENLCQILSDTKGMMLDSTLCDSGAVLRAAPDAGNPV